MGADFLDPVTCCACLGDRVEIVTALITDKRKVSHIKTVRYPGPRGFS